MVYTEWVVGLAHPNGEKLLDVIPLHEIISIQDCDGIGSADADDGAGRVLLEITLTVSFVQSPNRCINNLTPEVFSGPRSRWSDVQDLQVHWARQCSGRKGSVAKDFRNDRYGRNWQLQY